MGANDPVEIGHTSSQDVTFDRLQDQIDWYDRRSSSNQKAFKRLKICTISAAALVPVASVNGQSLAAALLGVAIVILEGLQQVYQYHTNWISYRATCEALKHEKFLFLANAGAYAKAATAADAHILLAEQIESLVSQEHAKWTSSQAQNQQQSAPPERKE